jgi:hypothetical protein
MTGDDQTWGAVFGWRPRDFSTIPHCDEQLRAVVDEAVGTLVLSRCPRGLADAAAAVSVLESLRVEIIVRIPDAVADARLQGCTWDDLALRLASTSSAVRHRYGFYVRCRRELDATAAETERGSGGSEV